MTLRCKDCDVNWWPYMTASGSCPQCGGGTVRTQDPVTAGVDELHARARTRRDKADLYERFERYYAEREAQRGPDAWRTAPPDTPDLQAA